MPQPFPHESPSDDELAEYLREVSVMKLPSRFQHDNDVDEAMRLGCEKFVAKTEETLLSALKRLNSLPRTDDFWKDNNRRPTIYKLPAFCEKILVQKPDDCQALWTLAVLRTFHGANDFGEQYWKRLLDLGEVDILWPLLAALWHEVIIGSGPMALATFILEADIAEQACPTLKTFTQARNLHIRTWATDVLQLTENRGAQ